MGLLAYCLNQRSSNRAALINATGAPSAQQRIALNFGWVNDYLDGPKQIIIDFNQVSCCASVVTQIPVDPHTVTLKH